MDVLELLILCVASFCAGIVNSMAGGGTLLTFPALVWVFGPGAQSFVAANATSTAALFPGSIASAWGYRKEIRGLKRWIWPMILPSLAGAALGTWLVTNREASEFAKLIPWLILVATILFYLQPAITRWSGIGSRPATEDQRASNMTIVVQFFIALYGGYFGAGIGILMLSSLALMGIADIHQMNGVKTVLASVINSVSVLLFMYYNQIVWSLALPMVLASIAGGYYGAVLAKKIDKKVVRYLIVVIGLGLSIHYFYSNYIAAGSAVPNPVKIESTTLDLPTVAR